MLLTSLGSIAYDAYIGGIYYNFDTEDKTATVTYESTSYNYYSYLGDIVIPNTVIYNDVTYNVTSIGDNAFYDCWKLSSITIPNSVTSIGNRAFEYCRGLTSVIIPNSVTSIGIAAFYGCTGLTSIIIPNSMTSIGKDAFHDCSGLTSINIPKSVTSIGSYAFNCCSGLISIVVESGNKRYDSRENCNAIIETATKTLVVGCMNTNIPNSVTSIGLCAFYGQSGLKSINIPNSVTSIGGSAFGYCSDLKSITIPMSVTSIGDIAFIGCIGLASIAIESGNKRYDSRENCNAIIETATNTLVAGCMNTNIPNSVTTIKDYAFAQCSGLTSITIPNSVYFIGKKSFEYCSGLTSVTIPKSVRYIDECAFFECSGLSSITIGNSVTSIRHFAFYNCSSLTDVYCLAKEIPSTIGDAFYNSSISWATLHVPSVSLEAYQTTEPWSGFGTIVALTAEEELTGIQEMSNDKCQMSNVIFDLNGRCISKPTKGIYVRNGKKVAIK